MRGNVGTPWRAPHVRPAGDRAPIRLTLPEEVLLARRFEALGLRDLRRLRVTDNRTVMVSLSPGRVLSIHRGYAKAPDRVLRAVVRFLKPGIRRNLSRAAEHEILTFRAETHVEGPPLRRRSADRPGPGDLEKLARLHRLFSEYNARHFGGLLPAPPIRISGRMRTRLGHLSLRHEDGRPYELTISRRHIDRHGWEEAAQTLLHEMVHLWQHQTGHDVDHGPLFHRKAEELGVVASAHRKVRTSKSRGRAARCD